MLWTLHRFTLSNLTAHIFIVQLRRHCTAMEKKKKKKPVQRHMVQRAKQGIEQSFQPQCLLLPIEPYCLFSMFNMLCFSVEPDPWRTTTMAPWVGLEVMCALLLPQAKLLKSRWEQVLLSPLIPFQRIWDCNRNDQFICLVSFCLEMINAGAMKYAFFPPDL